MTTHQPEPGAASVMSLLVHLSHVDELLRPLATKTDDQLTIEDSALLAQAHLMLAGGPNTAPYSEQAPAIHERLPYARGYGVVKHYNQSSVPSGPTLWPNMLFSSRALARRWADFLGDFYNTWGDEYKAQHTWGPVGYLDAKVGYPVGHGYLPRDHDRRKPMERWRWDKDQRLWVRK